MRALVGLVLMSALLFSQDKNQDVAAKIKASYKKAADWLVKGQQDSGAWARTFGKKKIESPALSCLALLGLAKAPEDVRAPYKGAIEKGTKYLVGLQAKDGSFAEPPDAMRTYVTALALMVMAAVDKDKFKDPIKKAQEWIKGSQSAEGVFAGGHGYGDIEYKGDGSKKESKFTNLSTTGMAAEAMKESGFDPKDEYWKKIAEFVARCQNNSETNVDPMWRKALEEKGFKIGNDGSVFYAPTIDDMKAGSQKDTDGKMTINGYGSMTYDGIKTYLMAGLGKDDPKVKAAVNWVREHWSLDAHPGFPFEKDQPASKRSSNMGLFYYYMLMATALDAVGENPFTTSDGKPHAWAAEMADKLISIQKEDGTWANENPKWWEADALTVTPYVLKVYGVLLRNVK